MKRSRFDRNAGQQIALFLEHQDPPVCLIAHEESEITLLAKSLAIVEVTLPDQLNIRCGNGFEAFRDLEAGIDDQASYEKHLEAFVSTTEDHKGVERKTLALMKATIEAGAAMISWFERNAVTELSKYVKMFAEEHFPHNKAAIKWHERYNEDCH